MNGKVKALWVKELRGGDFEQGKNYLRRGKECCCLGVLCELAMEEGVLLKIRVVSGEYSYDDNSGDLPNSVMVWAGLKKSNPHVVNDGQLRTLSGLNDYSDLGFKGIADLIDRQL